MFKLYWLDTRDGRGYRAKDYSGGFTFEQAAKIVATKPKHKSREWSRCELRYEPASVYEKYTAQSEEI